MAQCPSDPMKNAFPFGKSRAPPVLKPYGSYKETGTLASATHAFREGIYRSDFRVFLSTIKMLLSANFTHADSLWMPRQDGAELYVLVAGFQNLLSFKVPETRACNTFPFSRISEFASLNLTPGLGASVHLLDTSLYISPAEPPVPYSPPATYTRASLSTWEEK